MNPQHWPADDIAWMFYEIRVALSFERIVNRRRVTVRRLVTKGH